MKELTKDEMNSILAGGSVMVTAGRLIAMTAPGRCIVGAAMLGWAIGTAIDRTYGDEIGEAIDYVMN